MGLTSASKFVAAILVLRLLTFMFTSEAAVVQEVPSVCSNPVAMSAEDYATQCGTTPTGVLAFLRTMVVGSIEGAPWQINVPYVAVVNTLLAFQVAEVVRKFIPTLPGGD